jgi:hypothetical protein
VMNPAVGTGDFASRASTTSQLAEGEWLVSRPLDFLH